MLAVRTGEPIRLIPLQNAQFTRYVVQMKNSARHGEHVSHGDTHVHPAESMVDFEIMRAMLQRTGSVTADLTPDTRCTFQIVFQHDQLQKRWCQVKSQQQFQEESARHSADLYGKHANFTISSKIDD